MRKLSDIFSLPRVGPRRNPSGVQESERHSIVSQADAAQKQALRSGRQMRLAAALVFAVGVTLVLSAVLPRLALHDTTPFSHDALAYEGSSALGQLASGASRAILNPNIIPAVHVTRGPQIIPVSDENGDGEQDAALDAISFVTPTPTARQPDGFHLAGQQAQVLLPEGDVALDHATLSELLAPLLEDQIAPTPLVIQLEIPPGELRVPVTGLNSSELRPPSGKTSNFPRVMLLPTATPENAQALEAAAAAHVPVVEIVPAVGVKATPTPTAAPTATPVPQPTALWADNGPVAGRRWSSFSPRPPESSDHFWVGNPFADLTANSFASPNYQFGSTAGGRYRPHHGVDISNPSGTPIRAAVSGEVVFAGPDDVELLGPYNNFYGNAVVIRLDRRLPVAGGRLDVYVLYGHLSSVQVTAGQRVEPDDIAGYVGMTGIAIGPHLHVEVRLGANTYAHNVNPYLWMEPPPGTGAVAVRLLTNEGKTWAGAKVSIARFQGGAAVWARQIETYLDTENIGPDPAWGENGAMGDVPAGSYYLIGKINGEDVRAEFTVSEGQTTFVEYHTQE